MKTATSIYPSATDEPDPTVVHVAGQQDAIRLLRSIDEHAKKTRGYAGWILGVVAVWFVFSLALGGAAALMSAKAQADAQKLQPQIATP